MKDMYAACILFFVASASDLPSFPESPLAIGNYPTQLLADRGNASSNASSDATSTNATSTGFTVPLYASAGYGVWYGDLAVGTPA